jgi:hypothetical protein
MANYRFGGTIIACEEGMIVDEANGERNELWFLPKRWLIFTGLGLGGAGA